ncbi:MAG: hypothetical protein ACI9UV_003233 [Algoriphagus sp.]|jgi:hypothetical protein
MPKGFDFLGYKVTKFRFTRHEVPNTLKFWAFKISLFYFYLRALVA